MLSIPDAGNEDPLSLWYSGMRLPYCKQGETEQLQMFYNEYGRIPALQEGDEMTRVSTPNSIDLLHK